MAFSNPLRWPAGWPRTQYPQAPTFKASFQVTIQDLEIVLDRLEALNVVITTNQSLRLDGGLRTAAGSAPMDPGVALYFSRRRKEVCIPCDKFNTTYGNLRAIGLTLEYIRRMEVYGTSQMVDAVFRGFTTLPESIIMEAGTVRTWYDVLQVNQSADWDVIEAAYKRRLMKTHPDHGGTSIAMQETITAYNQAKEERGKL